MTSGLIEALPIVHLVLGVLLSALTLAFLARIVLTWYPKVNERKGFWIIVFLPTEPILEITRKFIAPIGGVDVTPVIWVGLVSLMRELLVGQQGIISQILFRTEIMS